MRPSRWSVSWAVLCAFALVLLAAPAAQAVTRTVLAVDPTGDGPRPGRDITGVRAHWDSAGSLVVTVAFAGAVATADRAQITANARAANGRDCLLQSQETYLLLSGYTGPATSDDRGFGIGSPGWLSLDVMRVRSDDGKSVTLLLDDPRIGEYDLGCVDIRLSADGNAVDAVDPVFFADGTDTDGDGVVDGKDACPQTSGTKADGCPETQSGTRSTELAPLPTERFGPPPSRIRLSMRRCVVPKLTRAPLDVVRRWLPLVDCRVGKVKKRVRRGDRGRWVVLKQSAKPGARHVRGTKVDLVVVRRPALKRKPAAERSATARG
jgi:hypothetical protein